MKKITVLEQIQNDFPADHIRVEGFYIYVGSRYRAFINVDADEIYHSRASSNRGRNYVVFLATYLYNRFRLVPKRDTLSYQLIEQVEVAKFRRFHERMQRFGQGLGYFEYWDGTHWNVKAVPFTNIDAFPRIPLPEPRGTAYDEKLEELEAIVEKAAPEDGDQPSSL